MRVFLLALALLAAAPAGAQTPSLYVNANYDIRRDPAVDLEAAKVRARAENKRILIEVGGKWCVWCTVLDRFLDDDTPSRAAFTTSFVVMKVNWSRENENAAFLSAYPNSEGYPDFFILDANGRFLGQQDTGALEKGRSYDSRKMITFAQRWRAS